MILPPLQPAPPHPQPRPANPHVEQEGTAQDRGFRRLLATMRGKPEAPPDTALPASADGQGGASDRARVFNEDGFFPSTGLPFAEGGEDPALPHVAVTQRGGPGLPAPLEGMPGPAAADAEPLPLPSRRGEARGRIPAGPFSRAGIAGRPAQPRNADLAMPLPPEPENALPSEGVIEPDAEGGAPIHTPRDPSSAEGSLNVRVSLAPDGESLGVRLGRLSREQRARLRLEIAQLLARHGISGAEIRLNGEIEPERGLMKEGR